MSEAPMHPQTGGSIKPTLRVLQREYIINLCSKVSVFNILFQQTEKERDTCRWHQDALLLIYPEQSALMPASRPLVLLPATRCMCNYDCCWLERLRRCITNKTSWPVKDWRVRFLRQARETWKWENDFALLSVRCGGVVFQTFWQLKTNWQGRSSPLTL